MVSSPQLSDLQKEILKGRYALPVEKTWDEVVDRVSKHVVACESPDKQEEILEQFKASMLPMDFVPGGRVLYGCGRSKPQLLNCFAFKVQDNAQSIGDLLHDVYITSVSFGGCGVNYSAIRPKGDMLQGMPGQAPGVVSEMRKIDCIGAEVKAGGARRAALIGLLHVTHPDVLEFLHVKLDLGELTNHNISVVINDDFLKAARAKKRWNFKFSGKTYRVWLLKRTGFRRVENEWVEQSDQIEVVAPDPEDAVIRAQIHHSLDESDKFEVIEEKELTADVILDLLAENAHKCGEPGIINESLIYRDLATQYFEGFASVNPCTEAVLPHHGNCCLGSINLSNMYDPVTNEVNWKRLAKTIRTGVRFLDNVLTTNQYPLPTMREVSHNSRRIGLGIMGLAYLFIKMGVRYGSDKSLEFVDRLMKTIRDEAFRASIELAKEKESFTKFDPEKYLECDYIKRLPPDIQEDIREHGIRNAVLLSIAPTGTISMLAGVSSGIEPIFSPVYIRRFRKGGTIVERIVVDPLFRRMFEGGEDTSMCVGSHNVTGEQHAEMIARIQQWIDQSISKTTNIAETTTVKGVSRYIQRYARHIKGWTIYREGSRSFENSDGAPFESIDISDKSRDDILNLINGGESNSATGACVLGEEGGCDF